MSKLKSIVSLLTGYLRAHDNLTLYENERVVTNSRNVNSDTSLVKLIAGGGSGHEPAHTGYVGDGMLTTSVCGELYTSPSVQHILNAMLITGTPDASILFIVKNYTGDRLNFGIAIELAKNRYKYNNIDMVIINDDISIDDSKVQPSVGRRGLAGTIFYHKIIGAMAARQKTLSEIVTYVNHLLTNSIICTIGFTFTINIPKGIRDIEIGKGIHGEPGAESIKDLDDFDRIYDILLEKFQKKIPKSSSVVMMLNNLGGTSEFTMNIFLNEINIKFTEVYKIVRIYAGHFLTSLNSEGISVTLINLSDPKDYLFITEYLNYETSTPCNIFELNERLGKSEKSIIKSTIEINQDLFKEQSYSSKFKNDRYATLFKTIIVRCAHDIIANTDLLNKMDSEFGDGDTGSSLASFANQIDDEIKNGTLKSFDNPKMILMHLAMIAQNAVGGTTGAIYCLFFQGVSSKIENDMIVDLPIWAAGVKAGVEIIMKYGHAKPGDRTLLEPLFTCSDALQNFTGMENLNKLCNESVAATQNLIPKSGRAAYTFSMGGQTHKPNYPDAGAKAVGIIINAIAEEINKFK